MVGVFITARLGSTRLNEKHLIEVNGKPFIEWLVKRFLISFNTKIKRNDLKISYVTILFRNFTRFSKKMGTGS